MFSGLCGSMGVTGWVVMAVLWTSVIAVVVWAIASLFPQRRGPAQPPEVDRSVTAGERGDVARVGGGRE